MVNTEGSKEYRFTVTGTIYVRPEMLVELYAHNGDVRGFALPDGTELLPMLALEKDERVALWTDDEMESAGIGILEYDETKFEPPLDIADTDIPALA